MSHKDRRAGAFCALAALPCAAALLAAMPVVAADLGIPVVDELGEPGFAPSQPAAWLRAPAERTEAARSDPGWSVFEDWTGLTVRADRWFFLTDRAMEARRETLGHHLFMRYRLELPARVSVGFAGAGQRALAGATLMDRVSADFQIESYTVVGCETGAGTRVRPVIVDLFKFNDGSSTGPADATGDHFVRVNVNREAFSPDHASLLTVGALVYRCADAACGSALSSIFSHVGWVSVGEPFTLRLEWDRANSRFVVGVNDGPDVTLTYPSSLDVLPARLPYLRIMQQNVNANCAAHATVTDSRIKVREIRTNPAAVVP